MKIYSQKEAIDFLNFFSTERIPFIFLTDFLGEKTIIQTLDEVKDTNLKYSINGKTNSTNSVALNINIVKQPISFDLYQKAFNSLKQNILLGNSFLTNLTCETPIKLSLNLEDIYESSEAKYKIWLKENENSN